MKNSGKSRKGKWIPVILALAMLLVTLGMTGCEQNKQEENTMSKLQETNEKIADAVVGGYKKIEEGVVGAYKKVEDGVTDTFQKIEDAFVDKFLTHEGETVKDAEKRLAEEQAQRDASGK